MATALLLSAAPGLLLGVWSSGNELPYISKGYKILQVQDMAGQMLVWKYSVKDVDCLIGRNPGGQEVFNYEQSPVYPPWRINL